MRFPVPKRYLSHFFNRCFTTLPGSSRSLLPQSANNDHIIEAFCCLIKPYNQFEQDDLFLRLRSTRLPQKLPPAPPKELNSQTINDYVQAITSCSYQYYPQTEEYIDKTINRLAQTSLLNLKSFNAITYYYTRKVDLKRCGEVRRLMVETSGTTPQIDNINMFIQLHFKKHNHSKRLSLVSQELHDAMMMEIKPNASTFYILYTFLNGISSRECILEKMIANRISLEPINNIIVKHKSENGENVPQILLFLKEHHIDQGNQVVNAIIECYLEDSKQDFLSAWKYMDECTEFKPNTKTIKVFVDYFNRRRQPYMSLSMISYLGDEHNIGDRSAFYIVMCEYLLDKNYKEWCVLAKYFYYLAGGRLSKYLKECLQVKGKEYDVTFDVEDALKSEELEKMGEISKGLTWQKPNVVLSENDDRYLEVVKKYFSS
ncbi:hypothetical protein FOA43_004699 [Brettanomyces nanus]|uniref:Uncharacterized protein n=1 Tax=Eeniella nana TaxID=13502 RepID=A0A875S6T6_EENNA|nr:uncharacterized protein FOA43_004699 [Brettanomyces nanus]QPG77291.1 hypothetical protein FOA43_004699 [Brettanomyces nanus]